MNNFQYVLTFGRLWRIWGLEVWMAVLSRHFRTASKCKSGFGSFSEISQWFPIIFMFLNVSSMSCPLCPSLHLHLSPLSNVYFCSSKTVVVAACIMLFYITWSLLMFFPYLKTPPQTCLTWLNFSSSFKIWVRHQLLHNTFLNLLWGGLRSLCFHRNLIILLSLNFP